jgi:hypothetical protein
MDQRMSDIGSSVLVGGLAGVIAGVLLVWWKWR